MLGCAFFVADGIFNTKMTIDHKMKNWKRFWPFSDELHIKRFLYELSLLPKRKTQQIRHTKNTKLTTAKVWHRENTKISFHLILFLFMCMKPLSIRSRDRQYSRKFSTRKLMTWKGRKFKLKEAQRENWSMIISSEVLWLVLSQHQGIKKRKEETTAIQKRNRRNGLK